MAADRLNIAYALQSRSIDFNQRQVVSLAQQPAVRRMHEFVGMGRLFDARREWGFVRETLPPADLAHLAILFDRWEWCDGAIRAVADSDHEGDLVLRFPLRYDDIVYREAQRQGLPVEWL